MEAGAGTSTPTPPSLSTLSMDECSPHELPSPSSTLTAHSTSVQQHTYVVDGLEEKIRESNRRSMRNSASNDQLMHPDPKILDDLEATSRRIASNVDQVVRELRGSLHGMSDLVVEAAQVYHSGICSSCDAADQHIKNTYATIAKVEELNGKLERVSKSAQQVKELRRNVEMFETIFKDS